MTQPISRPDHLWFMNTHVSIKVSSDAGGDGLSVLEHQARFGDSPPLHIHRNEDEVFYVLSGELRLDLGGEQVRLVAGETALARKGTPHSYRVESEEGARWLTIIRGGEFEEFVRTIGRPPETDGLPEPLGPPTVEQVDALAAIAARFGIELVGPPLH